MNSSGILISTVIHIILLLLLAFSFDSKLEHRDNAYVHVQLSPLAQVNNVPNKSVQKKANIVKKESPKKVEKKETVTEKKVPVANKSTKKVEKKVIKKKIEEPKKPTTNESIVKAPPKKEKKPKKEVEKKNINDELDNLLKNLEETIEKGKENNKAQEAVEEAGDEILSATQEDLIRSQIMENWHVPAGVFNVNEMWVKLYIKVDNDGKIQYVEDIAWSKHKGTTAYQIFVESAKRAVLKCGQLKGLDVKNYNAWKELNLIFNLKDMLNEMA